MSPLPYREACDAALAIVLSLPALIADIQAERDPDRRVVLVDEALTMLDRSLQPAAATFLTLPQIESIQAAWDKLITL